MQLHGFLFQIQDKHQSCSETWRENLERTQKTPPYPDLVPQHLITESGRVLLAVIISPFAIMATSEDNTSGIEEPQDWMATMEDCFKAFDKDEDNHLNFDEFSALLDALFRNEKGTPYPLDSIMIDDLFAIFNISEDGSMSKDEFIYCWNNWIKKILHPVSAFVVVDVQNDFISGNLSISECPAGHHGEEVIEPINKLSDSVPFDVFCYSLDWHPSDHLSFVDNVHKGVIHETSPIQDASKTAVYDTVVFTGPPMTEMTLWPRHCVQESWGAEFHKDLKVLEQGYVVHKGINPNVDSFSAFYDNKKLSHTELEAYLRSKNVTDIFVCGIAYDVCVGHTAFHGLELGFRTILVDNCSRGINMDNINITKDKIKNGHGLIIQSPEVKAMVQGRDRRVELGYFLALQCRHKIVYPSENKNSRFNQMPSALGQKVGSGKASNEPVTEEESEEPQNG
eukprot:maker-scaffold15_size728074-snap-gene-3.15 protein:Tk08851 transcript:maker-scaffold15_size728074-snap-gene-3.15-mRNA-1 annotation:"pyrazinamidase nicotinamidase"